MQNQNDVENEGKLFSVSTLNAWLSLIKTAFWVVGLVVTGAWAVQDIRTVNSAQDVAIDQLRKDSGRDRQESSDNFVAMNAQLIALREQQQQLLVQITELKVLVKQKQDGR